MFAFQKTKQNYTQDGEKLAFVYLWMDSIRCMVIFMKLFLCQVHVVHPPPKKNPHYKQELKKKHIKNKLKINDFKKLSNQAFPDKKCVIYEF